MGRLRNIEELFAGRHFDREVILLCVRWYLRYKLSFRDLVEMMAERGLQLAHTKILRWVRRYTPEFIKRWNRFDRCTGRSWRVDDCHGSAHRYGCGPSTGWLARGYESFGNQHGNDKSDCSHRTVDISLQLHTGRESHWGGTARLSALRTRWIWLCQFRQLTVRAFGPIQKSGVPSLQSDF
jgi:hypothetical protein